MDDAAVLKQRFPLIKYNRDGKQSWPIGEARFTKNGTGLHCSIHPGHQVNGSFYIILSQEDRDQHKTPSKTEDQKYDLIKYSKRTKKKWSVGEAYYTDNGANILCKIHPSYQLKGSFYFFG